MGAESHHKGAISATRSAAGAPSRRGTGVYRVRNLLFEKMYVLLSVRSLD